MENMTSESILEAIKQGQTQFYEKTITGNLIINQKNLNEIAFQDITINGNLEIKFVNLDRVSLHQVVVTGHLFISHVNCKKLLLQNSEFQRVSFYKAKISESSMFLNINIEEILNLDSSFLMGRGLITQEVKIKSDFLITESKIASLLFAKFQCEKLHFLKTEVINTINCLDDVALALKCFMYFGQKVDVHYNAIKNLFKRLN